MKAGETGYIKVAIPDLTLSAVDEIIFTLKSANNTVTKTYPTDVTLDGNTFLVPLTQANTIALNGFYQIEAQINFTDNSVSKSVTQRKYMSDTLATDLVTGNEPSEGQVNEVELTTSEIQIVTLTPSYNDLTSKPSINSVTLSGNKTASDLGLAKASDIPDVSGLASKSYVDNMALKTINGESIKGSGDIEVTVSEEQVTEKVNEVLAEDFPPKLTWIDVPAEVMPFEDYILSKTLSPWVNNPTYYKHTKFVLPRGGLKIRFSCKGYNASFPAVIYTDSNDNVVGYYGEDNTIRTDEVITLPQNATKVYLNGVANTIFALDYQTEIPLTDVSTNPLLGKKISCIGDSIMYGAGYIGGFIKLIADRNDMTMNNVAVSGGTLGSGANTSVFHICNHISDMADNSDYYIVEGGFNDYNYNTYGLGEITQTMTDDVNDRTLIGALESIFRQLLELYPSKKIGFVITHKALNSAYTLKKYTFNQAHDAIISVCNKYSIPYCDLYNNSRLNTELENMKAYTKNSDGIHPSKTGYSIFYVPQVEAWLKTL